MDRIIAQMIAANSPAMKRIATDALESLRYEVAEASEVVAIKRMSDLGITDPASPEAQRIAETTMHLFVSALLRHMSAANEYDIITQPDA